MGMGFQYMWHGIIERCDDAEYNITNMMHFALGKLTLIEQLTGLDWFGPIQHFSNIISHLQ